LSFILDHLTSVNICAFKSPILVSGVPYYDQPFCSNYLRKVVQKLREVETSGKCGTFGRLNKLEPGTSTAFSEDIQKIGIFVINFEALSNKKDLSSQSVLQAP
jgi:hypothetical protein